MLKETSWKQGAFHWNGLRILAVAYSYYIFDFAHNGARFTKKALIWRGHNKLKLLRKNTKNGKDYYAIRHLREKILEYPSPPPGKIAFSVLSVSFLLSVSTYQLQ